MDNQQVDASLAWLGGLIEGEGCLALSRYQQKNRFFYRPEITISNTNRVTMNAAANILKHHGLSVHLQWDRPNGKRKRPLLTLHVGGYKRVRRVLMAIRPYLQGKAIEADLLQEFMDRREEKLKNIERGQGQETALGWTSVPYDEHEHQLYHLIKERKHDVHLRDLEPHGGFLGPLEEIVQPLPETRRTVSDV